MESLCPLIANELSHLLAKTITAQDIERPLDKNQGDLAFPTFKYAKDKNTTPQLLAAQLAQDLSTRFQQQPTLASQFEIFAIQAYVNFRLKNPSLIENVILPTLNGTYGNYPGQRPHTKWVLEFSSPNVAKPFMIYHFRGTGVGASLTKIARKRGIDVTTLNHLGDWGTQFGKLFIANQRYRAGKVEIQRFEELVEIYVKFHQDVETQPELEDQGRHAFARLEAKDPEVVAFWKSCIEISLREFGRIYAALGIEFDHYWGESHYEDMLKPLLEKLKKEKILELSEGAYVARVKDAKGKELPPAILQKSDGSTIYATRDVAALLYRAEKFNFDKMIYVVGGEQKLHFEQVFGVVRAMGNPYVDRCEHVATGLYRFKDKKMSTRKGNFVTFEDVYALVKEHVIEKIKQRGDDNPDLINNADKIALGAIVYHDLSTDPARDVEFDVGHITDFEGETGPYLQYAHTRCLSIVSKAKDRGLTVEGAPSKKLEEELEASVSRQLVREIAQYPFCLERALTSKKPSALSRNLMDIAQAFGAFYRERHILIEDQELGRARLALVMATQRILAEGLDLLGIPRPEKM